METAQDIINEIEREELIRAREQSQDKGFVMDTFMYETTLQNIQEEGINKNRETRGKSKIPYAEKLIGSLK